MRQDKAEVTYKQSKAIIAAVSTAGLFEGKQKMRTFARPLIKIVAFLMGFTLLYFIIFDAIYRMNWDTAEMRGGFYKQEEDTVDVVCIGSSTTFAFFNCPMAFHQYGISSYDFCSGSQPLSATKYLIDDAEKYQDPKLYLVDFRPAPFGIGEETSITGVTSFIPRSLNRILAIKSMIGQVDEGTSSNFWDYYFIYPFFHDNWKNLKFSDFFQNKRATEAKWAKGIYKGFYSSSHDLLDWHSVPEFIPEIYQAAPKPIPERNEKMLRELLEYCQGLDADVLFVLSPNYGWEDYYAQINYCIDLIEEYGFDCLNAAAASDEIGIIPEEDCSEGTHLNNYGATKYTQYVCEYIKEHYDLPDHRGDEKYASWEEDYWAERKDMVKVTTLLHQEFNLLGQNACDGMILWSDVRMSERESGAIQRLLPEVDVEQLNGQQLAVVVRDGKVEQYQIGENAVVTYDGNIAQAAADGCIAMVGTEVYRCSEDGALFLAFDTETGEFFHTAEFYWDWDRDLMSTEASSFVRVPNIADELNDKWVSESALQMVGEYSDDLIAMYDFLPEDNDVYADSIMALEGESCTGQTVYLELESSDGLYRAYEMQPKERPDFAEQYNNSDYLWGGAYLYIDYGDVPKGEYTVRLFRESFDGEILYSFQTFTMKVE